MTDKERAFLIGLEKLSRETGIYIWGCGCCSSPAMNEFENEEELVPEAGYGLGHNGQVVWLSPGNYGWGKFLNSIVKGDNHE